MANSDSLNSITRVKGTPGTGTGELNNTKPAVPKKQRRKNVIV